MRVMQNATPGMPSQIHITPTRIGDYAIVCSQLCGLGHYRMHAILRVVSPQDFAAMDGATPSREQGELARDESSQSRSLARRSWLRRYVFTTSHRVVGVQYLLVALAAVVTGALLSLLMRWHLAWADTLIPGWGLIKPEDYLALLTLHGTLMIFFVTSAAPQNGLASLILPEQLRGTHASSDTIQPPAHSEVRMALPLLNALSVWFTLFALVALAVHAISSRAAQPFPAGPVIRPSAQISGRAGTKLRHGWMADCHRLIQLSVPC